MSQKVVLVSDPGIDGAFAVALALFDPELEVLGLAATAGNVSAKQATQNAHILIEQLDPPRWPRLGAAPMVEYEIDGTRLHGSTGLGNTPFPCAPLHHVPPSEKLVVDLLRAQPREVSVVCMGPCTVLARALDLYPELPSLARKFVILGGSLNEPGNAGPVSEFHFACDPEAARKVLHSGATIELIPLDVMRKVLLSPTDLLNLPQSSKACKFLAQIVPFGLAASCNMFGVESFPMMDALGIMAVAIPDAVRCKSMHVDVETRGELTRGMSVFDQRPWEPMTPNVDVATEINVNAVRGYMSRVLELELV
jgi:inosine-uridine nucleoside N-ribohydrolase